MELGQEQDGKLRVLVLRGKELDKMEQSFRTVAPVEGKVHFLDKLEHVVEGK